MDIQIIPVANPWAECADERHVVYRVEEGRAFLLDMFRTAGAARGYAERYALRLDADAQYTTPKGNLPRGVALLRPGAAWSCRVNVAAGHDWRRTVNMFSACHNGESDAFEHECRACGARRYFGADFPADVEECPALLVNRVENPDA